MSDYYNNVNNDIWTGWGFAGILSTINERKQFLLAHPEISLNPPVINNVTVSNDLVTVDAFNANSVELMATTNQYNSKFQSFIMSDDGTNGDILANDGIYTSIMPFSSGGMDVKFYIRAENDDAIKLKPQRAEYEFYSYSIISGLSSSEEHVDRRLIEVRDALGRPVKEQNNVPLFYIYDDGKVEKRIILE